MPPVNGRTPLPNPGDSAIDTPIPLRVCHGFAGTEETVYPDCDGMVTIAARAGEPLEICLDPDLDGPDLSPGGHIGPPLHRTGSSVRFAGCERVGTDVRPLPVGSRLDPITGLFTWLPGPGFKGTFHLEFVADHGGTTLRHRCDLLIGE